MPNFLSNNERMAKSVTDTLNPGLRNGIPTDSVYAIKKAQRTPMKLGDGLLKRGYVTEQINDPSVDAIKKIHRGGGRAETGDTLTKMHKGLTGPDIMNVTLPGQSSNALDSGASASRAGAVSSVVDRLPVEQTVSVFGARSSSVLSSRDALPTDKRKPRDRARRALARDNIEGPLDSPTRKATDESLDAIKLAHRQGPKPLFDR
jgi:hypothetical protein